MVPVAGTSNYSRSVARFPRQSVAVAVASFEMTWGGVKTNHHLTGGMNIHLSSFIHLSTVGNRRVPGDTQVVSPVGLLNWLDCQDLFLSISWALCVGCSETRYRCSILDFLRLWRY